MHRFSPVNSFLVRASLLLALLTVVAWRWPPATTKPLVDVPRADMAKPQKATAQFTTIEEAVVFAFDRIAAEQREDGSWGPRDGVGQAIEPATTETTGIVLLAFASAGQTHGQGKFRDHVQHGLDYLRNSGNVDNEWAPQRLMLPAQGQTTRSQALATLAICRLYSMTRDSQWERAAQFAVNELCQPRHRPKVESKDTDVVCWQLLAIVEAHMSNQTLTQEAVSDLQKWYAARIQTLPESSWQGNEFLGIRRFGLLLHERFHAPVKHFVQRSFDQQPVLEQFKTAAAFVEINYLEVGEPLQRLKTTVLSQFSREADLSVLALRVMILQSRLYKIPPSMKSPDDDFPLMSKHEDLWLFRIERTRVVGSL